MNSAQHLRIVSVGLAAICLFGMACVSKTTGNEGNLEFAYVADDDLADFNKPIGVGASLDLIVAQAGSSAGVVVKKATSDKPEVAEVISAGGNSVVLTGKGDGSFRLSVETTTPAGDSLNDSVDMLVRTPDTLKIRHYCTTGSNANYEVDRDVLIGFDMLAGGKSVIGWGLHPVIFEPADGFVLNKNTKDQASLHLRTAKTKQTVVIKSTIDGTTSTIGLVTEADFNGARLALVTEPVGGVFVGAQRLMHVRPLVDEVPVCQSGAVMTAGASTPDVCTVKATHSGNVTSWVTITGISVGKCTFTVTLPNGKGGQGVSETFTVDVKQVVKP